MKTVDALTQIKNALDNAPQNGYVAELHLQIIKYSGHLQNISGKEFCENIGINISFGTEFLKMRKISARLIAAGLDVHKI